MRRLLCRTCLWVSLILAFCPPGAFSQERSTEHAAVPEHEEDVASDTRTVSHEGEEPLEASPVKETVAPSEPAFFIATRKFADGGQFPLDDGTLDAVYQYQLNSGIHDYSTFAAFLMFHAQRALERDDPCEAIRLAIAAQRAAPSFPQPYWTLARSYWGESKVRVLRVIREWARGWVIGLGNFRIVVFLLSKLFFLIHLAFFLSTITLALLILCKNYRLFAYDVGGIIFGQRSSFVGNLWAVTLIIFPLLVGIGPVLAALYWLILFAVYLTKREKQVIWTIFLLLLLLPLSFRSQASIINAQQEGILNALYRANCEDWLDDTESRLTAWLVDHPQDKDVLFSLGLLKKRQGQYNEAEAYYSTILAAEPKNTRVINNLANVYHGKGRLKKAEELYQQAIGITREVGSLHYNLYRTYLELYKFLKVQQERELELARGFDAKHIDYQESIFRYGVVNRMVIDETLSFKEFWEKTFAYSNDREKLAASLWNPFLRPLPLKYGIFVFIALCFIVSFIFFQSSQRRFSVGCDKCGRPLSRVRAAHSVDIPNLCANCVSLFVDCRRVDQKTKQKKEKQVVRYEKRQNIIWTALTYGLPGGGLLWTGSPWSGTLCLFIFYAFIGKAVFWQGFIEDPLIIKASLSYAQIFLFGLIFVLFYVASVRLGQRRRSLIPDCIQTYRALRGKEELQKAGGSTEERMVE